MNSPKWERKPLEAVADLCLGKMLDQKKNRGEPFPYLANVNVRWGEFALDNLRMMRFEPREMDRYGLKHGDIVMCEGGEPGRCAIWKNQIPGMMIQKALHRIRPKDFLDNRYLFYSLLNIGQSNRFDQYFTGATIKHLPGEKLAKVEVDIPPLPIQRRIASILATYDDLIENNTRRIAILEEMARRIYEEWFVHFRFPGHEQVRMVESEVGLIPEGWKVASVDDVVEEIIDYRGKTPAKLGGEWASEGILALSALNVKHGRLINLEKSKLVSEALYQKWMKMPLWEMDILMTSEAPLGELYLLLGSKKYCLSQRLFGIRANRKILSPVLLYLCLGSENTQSDIASRATGATVGGIRQSELRKVQVLVPPRRLQDAGDPTLTGLLRLVANLHRKNANLRTTRDLLLPKLISGELDISHLPEAEAMAA